MSFVWTLIDESNIKLQFLQLSYKITLICYLSTICSHCQPSSDGVAIRT